MSPITRRQFVEGAGCAAAALSVSTLPSFAPGTGVQAAQGPTPATPGAGDWSRYGSDLRNTRFNPHETTIGKGNVDRLKEKWKFQVDVPIGTTPTVVGDTLFFSSYTTCYALDRETGREKWRYALPTGANGGIQRGFQVLQRPPFRW